jgi:hypothetical protein
LLARAAQGGGGTVCLPCRCTSAWLSMTPGVRFSGRSSRPSVTHHPASSATWWRYAHARSLPAAALPRLYPQVVDDADPVGGRDVVVVNATGFDEVSLRSYAMSTAHPSTLYDVARLDGVVTVSEARIVCA